MAIFVVNDKESTFDSREASGTQLFRMEKVEQQLKGTVKCVALPVSAVIDVDLESQKIEMRKDFDLQRLLN